VEGEPSTSGEGALSKPGCSPRLIEEDPLFSSHSEFSELCRLIKDSGLLQKKPEPWWPRAVILLFVIALVSAGMVLWRDSVGLQIADGLLLGFLFMQVAFVMHDVGHRQIVRSPVGNRTIGLLLGNLMLGVSYSWWVDKHNRHHRNPNHIDLDPDIEFAALAFSTEQATAKKWPWKLIVRYQAFLFLPSLLAEHVSLHVNSIEHVLRGRARDPWTEGILLTCHHVACFVIAFSVLGTLPAVAFLICGKAMAGLYAGLVFAPNHKGMLMVDSGSDVSLFRRQVLTSRNVRSGAINDFLYGGLNYQIEHHLFPFLRRDQMSAAQGVVRRFCQQRGIRYHETGIFQSLKEVLHHLNEVSAPIGADGLQEVSNLGGTP
jgi:fatty acid desaturase